MLSIKHSRPWKVEQVLEYIRKVVDFGYGFIENLYPSKIFYYYIFVGSFCILRIVWLPSGVSIYLGVEYRVNAAC